MTPSEYIIPPSMLHHHMPDHGVILQRVGAEVFAVAGLFQAAVGHLINQHEMGVDPGAAIAEGGGGLHGAADIAGPDG